LEKMEKIIYICSRFLQATKRVLEYHVKNKSNEKTSFRRFYGVWAAVCSMPHRCQHC
jgi:hypothetical protein